jgi:hypothetical protein
MHMGIFRGHPGRLAAAVRHGVGDGGGHHGRFAGAQALERVVSANLDVTAP